MRRQVSPGNGAEMSARKGLMSRRTEKRRKTVNVNKRRTDESDGTSVIQAETFFREYTSPAAIAKYSRATAGCGISYLLDHDYKEVYLEALRLLPPRTLETGIRILEFGCGTG